MRFDEFSEMVERNCFTSWRSVVGRDLEDLIESVNSMVVTRSCDDDGWTFSFGLRIDRKWYQAKRTIPPVEYDILEPQPHGEEFDPARSMSPDNTASELSIEIMSEVAEEVRRGA